MAVKPGSSVKKSCGSSVTPLDDVLILATGKHSYFPVAFYEINTISHEELYMSKSEWVYPPDTLFYQATDKGDRIMDFSSAGYIGGGTALPTNIPVLATLSPNGVDDTDAIQNAIDYVSTQPRDRYRGVIKLNPGVFKISKTVTINANGIILSGSGPEDNQTVIAMIGSEITLAFQVGESQPHSYSNSVDLTDDYIPSGVDAVKVSSVEGFNIGDRVVIRRTVTKEWISYLGMDNLVKDGVKQTWITPGKIIDTARAIKDIDPDSLTVTFDAPVTDSFDAEYLGKPVGALSVVTRNGGIAWAGIEHLQIKAPAGTAVYSAIQISNVINAYLFDIIGKETQNAFTVDRDALQVTLDTVVNAISVPQTADAPTCDFTVIGTQVLLNKCRSESDGTWGFVTGAYSAGPCVLLHCSSTNSLGVAPHQRWYTGILVDNTIIPTSTPKNAGVSFSNRGTFGTGQGWTTGWSVAWNVETLHLKIQAAPGTLNWAIGCTGEDVSPDPVGIFDSPNVKVLPESLYLEQLRLRKGIAAVRAIGY